MAYQASDSTNNKHLLVITPYFYPHLGGVEKHVLKTSLLLQSQLKSRGWQLDIITQQHESTLPTFEEVKGLSVHRFRLFEVRWLGLICIWWKMLTSYWQLFKQADVIHVHDVMVWLIPIRCLYPRKKIILTMHGWEGLYPIPFKNIWLKRLSARLATKVVAVGEYIGQYYGVKPNLVIYGGVDEMDVLTKAEVKKKQQLKTGQKLKLVYIGRLAADTGLKLLLQAWAKLPAKIKDKLEVVFVGDGQLRLECEQAGEVLGWVSEKRVRQELRQAKVCWASGYLSALEAMAAGCVVVVGAENELKEDYWQLGEMKGRVEVVTNFRQANEFFQEIKVGLEIKQKKADFSWIKQKIWGKVAQKYWSMY